VKTRCLGVYFICAREHTVPTFFTFEFVPEPSSLLLTALGAATLCAILRRGRFNPRCQVKGGRTGAAPSHFNNRD
jgi:hypothetical protein